MGMAPSAIVAYGVHLGGPENGWQLQGVEDHEPWRPSWYDKDRGDVISAAEERLRASVGFSVRPLNERPDDYYERRREAQAALGVEFVTACSLEYPDYVLAAYEDHRDWGGIIELDFTDLERQRVVAEFDRKLTYALNVLEIVPLQPQPRWMVFSYYS